MTHLRCCDKYDANFCCKFTAEFNSERSLKVCQHLSLCLRLEWHAFLTCSIVIITRALGQSKPPPSRQQH